MATLLGVTNNWHGSIEGLELKSDIHIFPAYGRLEITNHYRKTTPHDEEPR
jgi:hypothetical protein